MGREEVEVEEEEEEEEEEDDDDEERGGKERARPSKRSVQFKVVFKVAIQPEYRSGRLQTKKNTL